MKGWRQKLYAKFGKFANAAKSTVNTYVVTFLGLFGTTLVGFVGQVTDWASKGGSDPFPRTSVLGYAFVSALAAGGPALLIGALRSFQTVFNLGAPPQFPGLPATSNEKKDAVLPPVPPKE